MRGKSLNQIERIADKLVGVHTRIMLAVIRLEHATLNRQGELSARAPTVRPNIGARKNNMLNFPVLL